MGARIWQDVDSRLLKRLPNPQPLGFRYDTHETKEFTFLGAPGKPDYGKLRIELQCDQYIIELKSLKEYKDQFRDVVISYERAAEVIHRDLKGLLDPHDITVILELRPRGGFSSRIVKAG